MGTRDAKRADLVGITVRWSVWGGSFWDHLIPGSHLSATLVGTYLPFHRVIRNYGNPGGLGLSLSRYIKGIQWVTIICCVQLTYTIIGLLFFSKHI